MAWYHRLLNAVRGERVSREIDRELSFHLAERADELQAGGMGAAEAAREARRRFGNRTLVREHAQDADAFAWLASTMTDARYATRALVASPGFSLVVILSLAFGIGANTAIFSLTNALILKSLPVSHPDELLHLHMDSVNNADFTNPLWEQIRDQTASFASSAAQGTTSFNLAKVGVERRVNGAWVSGDFFNTLGVLPVAWLFSNADDVRGCAPTAVVTEGFADREYGTPSAALGKVVSLNGHPFEVIGVSDAHFFGLEVGRTSDIYAPLCAQTLLYGAKVLDARSRWYIEILLRPKQNLTAAQVNTRLRTIAPRVFGATVPANFSTADQREYQKQTLGTEPAATGLSDLRRTYRLALLTLTAIVGVVLVVACANIANLLLARAAARQREIAIRMAMGAGRWRLLRQLLTESLLLAAIGAALGILFAVWASRLVVGFLSTDRRPVFLDLSLDGHVLAFTMAVTAGTVVLFGLVPAWRATRVDPQLAMKAGGRGIAGGAGAYRLGRSLVVAQVSLSLALLAASGLLLSSFHKLLTLDPGFNREGVVLASVKFPNGNDKPDELLAAKRALLARLRTIPGVSSASASMLTPIGNAGWNEIVAVDGFSPSKQNDSIAYMNQVSSDYFTTLGTRLVAGHDVTESDIDQRRSVALINETMAHRFFSGRNPLGRTFRLQSGDTLGAPYEVIGVVGDAKYQRLNETTPATAYFPLGQGDTEGNEAQFELRGSVPPSALTPSVRAAITELSPGASMQTTTLEEQVSSSLLRPRLLATLSAFFGGLALVLAVIGLYGTMSYNVTRRKNEIGIRMALGAASGQVLRMITAEAASLIVAGIVCGGVLAWASTRFIQTLLFGLQPADPGIFALSALALGVVAMMAAAIPAMRAARQNPLEALRED